MRKVLYLILLVLSAVMTVLTVITSVLGTAGTEQSVFHSTWVVFVFAAFVLIQLVCLFTLKPRFSVYYVGFYLLHIGLVLTLVGCFVYYLVGDVVNVSIPVDRTAVYSEILREEPDSSGNTTLKLGFGLGVTDFKVEKYTEETGVTGTDKHYEATLQILANGKRVPETVSLTVNHPHHQNGWKIYLMNYDSITQSSVQLMLKKDPGEYVTLTGLWFIIIGTFVMCLLRRKGSGDTV